jgi:hypothetical protein
MDYEKLYSELLVQVRQEIPGFSVDYKDTSRDWKLRAAALVVGIFNKKFMTNYTTTLFSKVYFPSQEFVEADYRRAFRILAHEYVHLHDNKMHGWWFTVSYLFPQFPLPLLALAAIGAIWNGWFLFALVFLLTLLPWPAPGRTYWEMRGYMMTMAVTAWTTQKEVLEDMKGRISDIFLSSGYYWMGGMNFCCRKRIQEEVQYRGETVESEEDFAEFVRSKEEDSLPFERVKEILSET